MVLTEEERKARKKEYMKQYRQKNKEKIKQINDEWRENNKDKCKGYSNKYKQNNKDKIKEYNKQYYQTPQGKKCDMINHWKFRGVIGDFDKLYEKYINTTNCEVCNTTFTDKNVRCLDHDHDTGEFRNVLCNACNVNDNWKNKC